MWGYRVIIPSKHRQHILNELHRDHPGCSRMKSVARSYVWWPGIDKDIEDIAKSCLVCQSIKNVPQAAPLHPWTWPTKPWQRLHIDFVGPFLDINFLVVVDAHSKWPEVFEMSSTTSSKTIAVLRHLFAAYGLPEQIVSDNGPQFVSDEFKTFLQKNGVKHIRCAPYHPSSNGAVERFNQTMKKSLKASQKDGRTLSHRLSDFLLTYRSTPHATTNRVPCSLFLQREMRTVFSLLRPDTESRVVSKQSDQAKAHDRRTKSRSFDIEQDVMVRNYRPGSKWLPATVRRQLGPLTYIVKLCNGQEWKRHVDQIRGYQPATEEELLSSEDNSTEIDSSTHPIPTTSANDQPASSDQATPNFNPDQQSTTDSHQQSTTVSRYPSRIRKPPERLMLNIQSSLLREECSKCI